MKKTVCIIICISTVLLCGCSGGSVYSNYRDAEMLTVIETMGIDETDSGVTLTVSSGAGTGGSSKPQKSTCMFAEDRSISLARQKLQDYSASEELFFAHTAYLALGYDTAKRGIMPYLDYAARSQDLRLDVPMFTVCGTDAKTLISSAGGKNLDATSVFASVERDCEKLGDCLIFSVSDIIASLNENGCALMTAVKAKPASNSVADAQNDELAAIPDGYAVIKNGTAVGRIRMDSAPAVSIIKNRAGPFSIDLDCDGKRVTVRLGDCSCKQKGDKLIIDVSAVIAEREAAAAPDAVEKALKQRINDMIRSVLETSKRLRCDFLDLGMTEDSSFSLEISCETDRTRSALR